MKRFSTILLMTLPFLLAGQNTLKGTILVDGEGFPGATIRIIETNAGVVSNPDGSFEFNDLEVGAYQIEIRSVGFKIIKRKVTIPQSNSLTFELEESTLAMDEVIVTGTLQPTYVTASPVKVDVITSNYLNTYTPSASTSSVECIALVIGVQEQLACGVCFTNSISINGLPGPYTAVLMDGAPIYGNLASVYGLNGIPSMIIDRFEVIKGPSSTLYGSEAVAGVINIITKDPAKQPVVSADVMGTSHYESFGNFSVAPSIGKSRGFIGLNYAYINDFDDRNEDGFGDNINLDRISLFSKWNIHRPSGKQFTITGKYFYEDRRNGVQEFLENRNYRELRGNDEIYGESIYTNRVELFGSYELPVSEQIRIDYSISTHDQDSYYGADYYRASQNIAFANLIWSRPVGRHDLTGGFTSRYQTYDDNTIATEQTTLRTNAGTGFRRVNLFTEDHAFVTGQREVIIEEELRPEESYNISLNMNHIYSLGESQGMIDIDLFHSYFTNKITPDYETNGEIRYANADGFAVSQGIGLNLQHEFAFPLSFNAGINWQDVTETENGEKRDIEFAPQWTGIFTANYRYPKWKLSIGYTAQVTGPLALPEVFDLDENGNPLSNPRPTNSASFAIHNIQISKQLHKGWSIYGGLQNIFDYVQPWSPLTGADDPNSNLGFSDSFDTAYAYAPIHGREFFLGINWNLKRN
mgnify:CR=1 FL=1